ncbi:hypothetical protein ABIA32_002608 [Streptacidiphilus sp. MAP12-20]|uniref:DUF3043 domain-containing protein n=1 Tax=Streptacidiphilus sp. MAP12-20 TaxID=3156299 RepID=UPI003518903F
MFRRSSQDAPADAVTLDKSDGDDAAADVPTAQAPKGRPTPKRSEAEANRRGRAYVPPDRKAAARKNREAGRTDRERQMMALRGQGDPRDLPPRDRGPVRAFVRDYIDSRWTIFEFFLPILLVILVLSITKIPVLILTSIILWPVSMVLIVLQAAFLVFGLRKQLAQRFAGQNTKGAVAYALMRMMQMRRLRLPKAVVARGQKP